MLIAHNNLAARAGVETESDPLIQTFRTGGTSFNPSKLGPINATLREFAEKLRWTVADPSKAFVDVAFGPHYAGRKIRVVSGIGHNLSAGGSFRVTLASGSTIDDAVRTRFRSPSGVGTLVNIDSHVASAVGGDPDQITTTTLRPTSTGDTQANYPFTSPGGNLRAGDNLQAFRVLVGLVTAGGAGNADPSDSADVSVDLYESGGLVANLGTFVCDQGIDDGGTVRSLHWDAGLLAGIDGEDVEIRISATVTGGSKSVVPMAVTWYAELDGAVEDSGWLDAYPSHLEDAGTWPFQRKVDFALAQEYTLTEDWDVVTLRLHDPFNVAGFSELSSVFIGPALAPPKSFTFETEGLNEDLTEVDLMRSGEDFDDLGAIRRVQPFACPALTRDQAAEFKTKLATVGASGEILVVPDETRPDLFATDNIYGRLLVQGTRVSPRTRNFWDVFFQIVERNVVDGSLQLFGAPATSYVLGTTDGFAITTDDLEAIEL